MTSDDRSTYGTSSFEMSNVFINALLCLKSEMTQATTDQAQAI
jgi:hypothetical protein